MQGRGLGDSRLGACGVDDSGIGASGFGDSAARLNVYVANAPPMQEFKALSGCQPLLPGQIDQIYQHCGNGWRKVFNVYAKLVLALPAAWQPASLPALQQQTATLLRWQDWRDRALLQQHSDSALWFSPPDLQKTDCLHIIAGRQHARALVAQGLPCQLQWLDDEFAVDAAHRLLVCPYLDYRQLSDSKIGRLVALIRQLPPDCG